MLDTSNRPQLLYEKLWWIRLRFQIAAGQAEGLKKMREARKDLARVKTLLRETELRKKK